MDAPQSVPVGLAALGEKLAQQDCIDAATPPWTH